MSDDPMDEARPETRPETRAVHAGRGAPAIEGAVVPPIFQCATYLTRDAETEPRYLRLSNAPDQLALGARLAALEGTEAALPAGSGMAAITAALLTVAGSGDHVIAQDCLYGGTRALLSGLARRMGVQVDFVSLEDPAAWKAALRPETKAFHCEAISNPLMGVGRLDEAAAFAREHGLVSIIDATFVTPVLFRPARMGFDLVLHSGTKYLGGHSDLVAGAICGPARLVEACRTTLLLTGASLDPNSCFLLARGLKTLALRVRAASDAAQRLAQELDDHPAVRRVHHPSLRANPGHERAAEWFEGFGGMLSFVPEGGEEAARRILSRLRLATVAPSLGGVETLVSQPARTSHLALPRSERHALGIPDEMIRVSVGIEHAEDLIADFRHAVGG